MADDEVEDFSFGRQPKAKQAKVQPTIDDNEVEDFKIGGKSTANTVSPSALNSGIIPKTEEKWSNPKYIANQLLGGDSAVVSGMPFLRDYIPKSETGQERNENVRKTFPIASMIGEGVNKAVGYGLATLPFAGIGGIGAQGLIHGGISGADAYTHDPNISKEDLATQTGLGVLGGSLGTAAGKAVAPHLMPREFGPPNINIGHYSHPAIGVPPVAGTSGAIPIEAGRAAAENAAKWSGYMEKLAHYMPEWWGKALPGEAAKDILKGVGNKIGSNQMTPGANIMLQQLIRGGAKQYPEGEY